MKEEVFSASLLRRLSKRVLSRGGQRAVPSFHARTVPIYLGATAGMQIADTECKAEVVAAVRSVLCASGFVFRVVWARNILGEEEGAYGWQVGQPPEERWALPTSSTTYGTLDLVGPAPRYHSRCQLPRRTSYPCGSTAWRSEAMSPV